MTRDRRGGVFLQKFVALIPAKSLKQARFIAAGFCVSMAVLRPGGLLYKDIVRTVSFSTTKQVTMTFKSRLESIQKQFETELAVSVAALWKDSARSGAARIRRDLPFDVIVVFDHERKLVDGFRFISVSNSNGDLTPAAAKAMVPVDSGFFDDLSQVPSVSGILMVEGKPLLIAAQRIALARGSNVPGYAVIGRWFDISSLSREDDKAPSKIEVYSLTAEDSMPLDVKEALTLAQRNDGFTFDLTPNGTGTLYSLLDDITKRPALILKSPWTLPIQESAVRGLGLFYGASVAAGVFTWLLLSYFDYRNRHRMRRFEGLSSLSRENLRAFVEAFPGYCFLMDSKFKYIGVSRILAGVTGHEPSDFVDEDFGSVSSEWNEGTMVGVFEKLRDPARWPPVAPVDHIAEGLGRHFEFEGMAHYMGRQDMILVILKQKEGALFVRLPEEKSKIKLSNSAVA